MNLRTHALSDIGRIRAENEDSFLCDDQRRIYAVADGIGGLPAGAQASQLAIATLHDYFLHLGENESPDYAGCLEEVNERVFRLGQTLSARMGIGTTLTAGHLRGDRLHVIHVGDSILFRFRNGQVEQLTTDHNVENEVRLRLARGEPVGLVMENRLALTRCVGQPPPLEGDLLEFDVRPGDRLLFCSDGVTRMMTPREIASRLAVAPNPEAWLKSLIERANERGGYDNATGVALYAD
ncbi:MAG TPA: protein phosphatase 2C domain-containing protein [Opitutaceae bacterium]|nr:protein phosphatase 2C domain-containing protein [Opitutaceae bacterium]